MPQKHRKYSLYKDYLSFASVIILSTFLLSIVIGIYIYNSYKNHNSIIIETEGDRIESILSEIFDYTNRISVYMGKQIAEKDPSDLNFIYTTFKKTSGEQYRATNLFSWSLFDWVDKNNRQVINSQHGIVKNPPDMSYRSYTWKCRVSPWILQLSKPGIGNPSGKWVIPAGTGILDKSDNYIGAIVVGFNIELLSEKIMQAISSSHVSYVILDTDYSLVMQSIDNKIDPESQFFKNIFSKKTFFSSKKNGELISPIEIENVSYTHYNKMDNYPYIILTGFNKSFTTNEFYSILLPRIIELAGMSCFFLVLLFLFRQHIILPIVKLSDTADKIMRGQTVKKAPRTPTYETTNLAKKLIYLQSYIKRIKRIDKKLLESQREAESANRAKSDFLANMSHELRTPLNAIIGYSEMIKTEIFGPVNNPKYLEYSKDIYDAGKSLLVVVSDLLDLSRSDVGKLELDKTNINLKNIITESIKILAEKSEHKNIAIKINAKSDIPFIFADEMRIKQIVINILSNAIKFSYPNSEILISLRDTEKNIELSIKDQGVGIAKKDIPKILEKFGYVKNALSRSSEGTGLGLWVAKMLVEEHGGNLTIVSSLGNGTEVIINLPKNLNKD